MAIQSYLRSAEFTYSLQSPVQGGYDGNGLSVLADFLTQKSGYCIHFASAMAVMARLEGIPSRIAVGYAPGRSTGATVSVAGQGPLPEYEVDCPGRPRVAGAVLPGPRLGRRSSRRPPAGSSRPTPRRPHAQRRQHQRTQRRPDARRRFHPGAGPHLRPRSRFPGRDSDCRQTRGRAQALYGVGAVLLLALLVASPRLARARRAAPPAEPVGPRQWRRTGGAGLGGTARPRHGLRRGAREQRNAPAFLPAAAGLRGTGGTIGRILRETLRRGQSRATGRRVPH